MTEPTKTTSEDWFGEPVSVTQRHADRLLHALRPPTETREADRRMASARAIVIPAGEQPSGPWREAVQVRIEVLFPEGSMPVDKSLVSERVLLHTEAKGELTTPELRIIRAQLEDSVHAIMRAIESVHAEHMAAQEAKTDG